MDRKEHVRAEIYGHRTGDLPDRHRPAHRQGMAQGLGRGPCRRSAGGGPRVEGLSAVNTFPSAAWGGSLGPACRAVLLTPDPREKVMLARRVARDWRLGRIGWGFDA